MPQAPYAKVRASVNGGAVVYGGLTAAAGSTVQLSADPSASVGVFQYKWEIYDYPVGFAAPSGWSTDANQVYYYNGTTPPIFTLASIASFGKYMFRLVVNSGVSSNPKTIPVTQLVDESTGIDVIGLSGIHDIGFGESAQWSSAKNYIFHLKANLRLIDQWINGGGGGGAGVTAHSALTGLSANDHPQYLLITGVTAMTGNLAMGNHKITGLATPTLATDAVTKAYVDSLTVSGVIKADGSVPWTANQPVGGFKLTGLGTPTISTDAATKAYVDATILPAGTVPFTANQSMGGYKLTSVGTPTASGDAVNKAYADAAAASETRVRLATAAALPTNTRAGNVLTASANGALTVDGTAVATGNDILVKNEVTGANNGLYTVTAAGTAGTPFVLTRTSAPIVSGMMVSVAIGTANNCKVFILKTDGAITVNVTALDFQVGTGPTGATGAAGAAGATGPTGPPGTTGPAGADAFSVIPGPNLTDTSVTIAPGITAGMKFTLPAGTLTANRILKLQGGVGIRAFDTVFIEVFDTGAFTYTIRNDGAAPADMIAKPVSPGCKRIYSFQWDGADFFPCNSTIVV
jgi:hypothetical protein